MGQIVILDENTSNQIAAGEVVEKPASVVKELVENSIDAKSSNISIEIQKGGVAQIKVVDNGCGMQEDDVQIAFERHATSKIRSSNDLEAISTLGFRGEALASIASVSFVDLTSRTKDKSFGNHVKIRGGVLEDISQTGCPVGTTFIVKDLFFNTPARFKFLKKDSTEAGYISDMVNRIALGNPHISFKLINNKKTVLRTPGNNDLISTIFSLYGKETAKECIKVSYKDEMFEISGYAGKPSIARSTRKWQSIYINGRYIKNKVISAAIDEAYKTSLMKNKFAFVVLNIKINPVLVDVNVHPTKMEVRFTKEQDIFRAVYHAVNNALLSKSLMKNIKIEDKKRNAFKYEESKKEIDYIQQGIKTVQNDNVSSNISVSENIQNEPLEPIKKDVTKSESLENKTIVKKSLDNMLKKEEKPVETEKIQIDKKFKEDITNVNKPEVSKKIKEEIKKEKISYKNLENNKNEEHNKKDETNKGSMLSNSKIIGQIFSTYIILQNGENLILIDQHAAHERIMFEKLKEKYYKRENLAQYLLEPVVLELTNQEIGFINDKNETLNKLGFIIENFGNNSIILRSVPSSSEREGIKEAFLDILDFLMSENKKDDVYIVEEILYKMACKSAVKANVRLDDIEISNILKELSYIKNPYTCPHGRPTIIKITKHELEKMFKRIV
ncbi:DNA mismatch repair endonuclease MutL [Herbivorax sp. ANBcel31]|uniref:DNA mismatch repair endonuclease MutL n=1 Tax=Herbivorax sp. ANBcel31 TaxID=3069754 RepID=UPI0027B5AB53|nr:DNA mismatch repair endonuclease MutL [Herbivorax sp. ANBcel31]MDQ2087008.1 DNA mismatch repair endonuclease MutL [Herbivorax sp. ANBcel31]